MRAREILQEDYSENLENDLNNLLVSAKANNSTAISTNDLVAQMTHMGYSVNAQSILGLLTKNPNVTNATPEVINLQVPGEQTGNSTGSAQDTADHVSSLAQKANPLS